MAVPPTYVDLGKPARDVFTKGYGECCPRGLPSIAVACGVVGLPITVIATLVSQLSALSEKELNLPCCVEHMGDVPKAVGS